MDPKLQQALVATRAGYPETAQMLLTDLIQAQPDEADAWFMLSYLVNGSERQARYLQQVLALDPTHALAAEHLQRLRQGVPPPVIKGQPRPSGRNAATGAGAATPSNPAPAPAPQPAGGAAPATAGELPEWLRDLDNKRLGTPVTRPAAASPNQTWAGAAGSPVRERTAVAARTVVPEKTVPAPVESPQQGSVSANQKLLLGVLLTLVIMSMLVLGVLLWQIFM